MCEAFCVNGRHGTNISNITISRHIRFHEYESDLRSNEHYLKSSEKKA